MKNNRELLENLRFQMQALGHEELIGIRYFNYLENEELIWILDLPFAKFHEYMNYIAELYQHNAFKYVDCERRIHFVLEQLLAITDKKFKNSILKLLYITNFLSYQLFEAAFLDILNIRDNYKLDAIIKILKVQGKVANLPIRKMIFDINRCKTHRQVDALYNIFMTYDFLSINNLNSIVSTIINHPNCKYLEDFSILVMDDEINTNSRDFKAISYLISCKNAEQASLLKYVINNYGTVKSYGYYTLLEIISKEFDPSTLKCMRILIDNSKGLSDYMFKQLLSAIRKAKSVYQKESLLYLSQSNLVLNDEEKATVFINKILLAKSTFQIDAILKFVDHSFYGEKDEDLVYINSILKTTKDYQAKCITDSYENLNNTVYKTYILNIICNTTNKKTCEYISHMLKKEKLLNNPSIMNYINILITLENDDQRTTLMRLVDIEDLSNYPCWNILAKLKKCNKFKCSIILSLFEDYSFYKSPCLNYIHFVLDEDDKTIVSLMLHVLYNSSELGNEKTLKMLTFIAKNHDDVELVETQMASWFLTEKGAISSVILKDLQEVKKELVISKKLIKKPNNIGE